jgi:hypothetical protein
MTAGTGQGTTAWTEGAGRRRGRLKGGGRAEDWLQQQRRNIEAKSGWAGLRSGAGTARARRLLVGRPRHGRCTCQVRTAAPRAGPAMPARPHDHRVTWPSCRRRPRSRLPRSSAAVGVGGSHRC